MSHHIMFSSSQWQELIHEQESSGLSITAWCSSNSISRSDFHYWKKKLRSEKAVADPPNAADSHPLVADITPECSEDPDNLQISKNQKTKYRLPAASVTTGNITIDIFEDAPVYLADLIIREALHAQA